MELTRGLPGPISQRRLTLEGPFMFASLARAVFGTANERSLKAYQKRVPQINALEPRMQAMSDDELRGQTAAFRARRKRPETRCASTKTAAPHRFCGARAARRASGGAGECCFEAFGG